MPKCTYECFIYAITECSVCIKKETFAGLNHDYSFVSEVFLTAKNIDEIYCYLFLILCIRIWQFQFQLYFFSQNSWGLTLAMVSPKEFCSIIFGFFSPQIGKKYELLFSLVGLVEDVPVRGSMARGGDWGIFKVHSNPSPLMILWISRHQLRLNKAMTTWFKTFTTPSAQTCYPEHFWRHLVRWLYKLSGSFLKMKILKT